MRITIEIDGLGSYAASVARDGVPAGNGADADRDTAAAGIATAPSSVAAVNAGPAPTGLGHGAPAGGTPTGGATQDPGLSAGSAPQMS